MSDLIIRNHLIRAPIVEILNKVRSELNNSIFNDIQEKGDYVSTNCPVHKGGHERHSSFGIYCGDNPDIEYGFGHCFTCGMSGPLYHIIAECFNETDEFGKQWLIDNFGDTLIDSELNLTSIELDLKDKQVEYLDESLLDKFQSFHPYMTKRHLTPNVIELFKIKYDPQTQCLVFPVWDEKNNLVMLTRRSVMTKAFLIDANKEKPVYLYNFIKQRGIREVTVVESQINCLTLYSWGYPSIGLFGTGTKHQYEILNKSNINHYYLALDGDSAGDKGIKRFLDNIRKDVFVDIIKIPRGKDVNDLTQEEFEKLPIVSREEWLNEQK